MTDLEKLEAAEKIIDKSFIKIKQPPSTITYLFTDMNGKPLSPETKLWELVGGCLIEDTRLIQIIINKIETNK